MMMPVPGLLDHLSEGGELVFLSSSAPVVRLLPVSELRVSRAECARRSPGNGAGTPGNPAGCAHIIDYAEQFQQ